MQLDTRTCVLVLLILSPFLVFLLHPNQGHGDGGRVNDAVPSQGVALDEKRFYIYPFPEDVTDRWPRAYNHTKLGINQEYKMNYGIGPAINLQEGRYKTHQYSLFRTFYYRLLESRYRTSNINEADYFFIPYDIGMDCSIRYTDGALDRTNCPKMSQVMTLLNGEYSTTFHRKQGSDHFMLHSINHMMTHFLHKGCFGLYQSCYNCTKLSIDLYDEDLYPMLKTYPFLRHNWYSIPFPSDYHYSKQVTTIPWMRSIGDVKRQYIFSFMGSNQVTARKLKALRELLADYCLRTSGTCNYVQLQSHHSLTDVQRLANYPYYSSTYCFMPGGDFLTRKGVLDSLFSGCIPVIFNEYTATKQWPWHWGNSDMARCCVEYIPLDEMMHSPEKAVEKLIIMSRNSTYITTKVNCAAKIGNYLQYNVPSGSRHYDNNNQYEDAVDKILQQILQ